MTTISHTTLNLENDILALILFEKGERKQVFYKLTEKMFNDPVNSKIFAECKKLSLENEEIEKSILMANLKDLSIAERLYELEFTDKLSVKLFDYCAKLQELYFEKLITEAKTPKEAKNILELMEEISFEDCSIISLADVKINLEERIKNKNKKGVYSNYGELDNIIGSFQGGDMITIGGNPSHGKTSFALNIARNVCTQYKKVLIFSLEMSATQLTEKLTCMDARVGTHKLRNTELLTKEEKERFEEAYSKRGQWNIRVHDKAVKKGQRHQITIDYIGEIIKKEVKAKNCDFVIIDYMGLLDCKEKLAEYERYSMFSRRIKRLAMENEVPILNLVQLNRSNIDRSTKLERSKFKTEEEYIEKKIKSAFPTLADIRGSGAIEQDSDMVLFVLRPYKIVPIKGSETKLKILIAKNRYGEAEREVNLFFNPETQVIKDWISKKEE